MARRKTSPLEDLLSIASEIPWWLSLVFAAVTYGLLHTYATRPPAPPQPGDLTFVTEQMYRQFAAVLQYGIPAIFVIGALTGIAGRLQRRRLYGATVRGDIAHNLCAMSWRDFEIAIGERFRRQGFQVFETARGADGGVDLELRREGELALVQCKHWKAHRVGVDVVRQLYGVMADQGATAGFVVTTGRFTDPATAFARDKNITLLGGKELAGLALAPTQDKPTATSMPLCPRCDSPMVQRTARRGKNTGREFWGCSTFPACRGTRPA